MRTLPNRIGIEGGRSLKVTDGEKTQGNGGRVTCEHNIVVVELHPMSVIKKDRGNGLAFEGLSSVRGLGVIPVTSGRSRKLPDQLQTN